jgi:hypothetical protein
LAQHAPASPFVSTQAVPYAVMVSAGHDLLTPSHVSAVSQGPKEARQTVPDARTLHVVSSQHPSVAEHVAFVAS